MEPKLTGKIVRNGKEAEFPLALEVEKVRYILSRGVSDSDNVALAKGVENVLSTFNENFLSTLKEAGAKVLVTFEDDDTKPITYTAGQVVFKALQVRDVALEYAPFKVKYLAIMARECEDGKLPEPERKSKTKDKPATTPAAPAVDLAAILKALE